MVSDRSAMERQHHMHWSVILSGAFTAVGVWMFLYALGAAIGGAGAERGPTTWTAIYTVCAPVIGFFFGGLMIGRAGGVETKGDGTLHAVAAWGFGMVIGSFLLSIMGAEILVHIHNRLNVPDGYFWAIAGSILGSLITCVLGAVTVPSHERAREEMPVSTRGEVYP
jgi:hypothetical protein